MATFLVRIELPDRPGALGAVASRIGAVRGDVVSIEIIRRQDGRALDEFVVELADAELVPLLLTEIAEVDGPDGPTSADQVVDQLVAGHPLLAGIEPGTAFYFVHSYVVAPRDPAIVLAESEHGSRFPAAIAAGNLLGVQFHPERSGPDGLRLLANFVAIAAGSVAGVSQGAGARAEVPA